MPLMNARQTISGLLVTATLSLLAGCGGVSEEEQARAAQKASESAEAEASESAAAEREAAAEAAAAEEAAADRAAKNQCRKRTSGLTGALQQVDSRLSIGMNFSEYSDRVGDAQVAYDALFRGQDLPLQCLMNVGVPLEKALNDYIDVYNIWNDCIGDYACDFNEGVTNDKAQKGWAGATKALGVADRGMRKVTADETF